MPSVIIKIEGTDNQTYKHLMRFEKHPQYPYYGMTYYNLTDRCIYTYSYGWHRMIKPELEEYMLFLKNKLCAYGSTVLKDNSIIVKIPSHDSLDLFKQKIITDLETFRFYKRKRINIHEYEERYVKLGYKITLNTGEFKCL